jgi:hypothetical protein
MNRTEPAISHPGRSIFRPGCFRYSAVELLVVLLLLIFSTPLVEDLPQGDLIDAVLLTLVMASAVLAIGRQRRSLVIALVLVTPALGGKWANHFRPDLVPAAVFLVAAIAFFLFVVVRLVRFVMQAPMVDANVLCAGLCGFLMLGLLWVPAYMLAAQMTPGAFAINQAIEGQSAMSGFRALYFSFITLCTVGYGDVTPLSKTARMLVVMQSIVGLFYTTVLVARLVAIYSTTRPNHGGDDCQ